MKIKVAIWVETGWALGRIHNALIKYMSKTFGSGTPKEYVFTFKYFNWANSDHTTELLHNWKSYDVIISNTAFYDNRFNFFNQFYNDDDFLKRVLAISHFPLIEHPYYLETINNLPQEKYPKINLANVCRSGIEIWNKHYNFKSFAPNNEILWLPCGVDLEDFNDCVAGTEGSKENNFSGTFSSIKNIGIIGKPDYPPWVESNKRVYIFKSIAEKTGLNPIFIHSRPFTDNAELYKDIDMLICTSEFEAGPLGILEAAAMGIPVISTKVGNLVELESLKFFENDDEAVALINMFNSNLEELKTYRNKVTTEVRAKFGWETLIEKFWLPTLVKIKESL